jgi:hypothetical protein
MASKKSGGGPQAVVSSGKPDVWVTVRDGSSIDHGEGKARKTYNAGDRFTCNMDQAMSLLQSGHVDIGEVVQ